MLTQINPFCLTKTRSADPYQTHSVASDLILHCLPMTNKMDARLIWVNIRVDKILVQRLFALKNNR